MDEWVMKTWCIYTSFSQPQNNVFLSLFWQHGWVELQDNVLWKVRQTYTKPNTTTPVIYVT